MSRKIQKINIFIILIVTLVLGVKLFFPASREEIKPVSNSEIKSCQRPPQFVILSFDGSRSLPMWEKTLDFAEIQAKKGVNLKFTYFISGVYFLPVKDRMAYQSPGELKGESKIGFAINTEDVAKRASLINRADTEGHEIGSHLNGHFPGGKWTEADWQQEFLTFSDLTDKTPGLIIKSGQITGFRAPNLATNQNLWPVMQKYGYKYEAGQTGKQSDWPVKKDGIWRFIIPAINLSKTKHYPLAMDYNFYITQTDGRDIYKKGTAEWQKALLQTVDSLNTYFESNYYRNRAPVVFAAHFTEWNDGLYWEAMKTFAENVCGKPEVKCVTYQNMVDYLEKI